MNANDAKKLAIENALEFGDVCKVLKTIEIASIKGQFEITVPDLNKEGKTTLILLEHKLTVGVR